ncbi:cytochrome P450 [Flavimaricola marinus]|nr:cytochrome P450 [Flavimaricola marinus]
MEKFSQSPTAPAFVQDPYPFYDTARRAGDLFWWTDYNIACAVSHKAVSAILRDRRLGRETPAELAGPVPPELAPFYDIEEHSLLEVEPPKHTRLRGLVLRAFTSRRIGELAPDITALSHELIDKFPPPGTAFDLLDAFARPLPVTIICRLLGVPEDRADDLLRWSNAMVAMYQARRTAQIETDAAQASREFTAFLTDYIDQKRQRPGDDLITQLIAAEEDGEKLSTEELISTCILLLNAGHEATVHTLGNGAATLLDHERCDITEACTEEILRFDAPLHMFRRWVYDDITLFGHDFKRGDQIACLLGAANRDPAAYPDPNTFDPARKGPANTSLGAGLHFCVGAPLARLEIRIGLDALFTRCPTLKLAEAPRYADLYHFHGLEKLMVTT